MYGYCTPSTPQSTTSSCPRLLAALTGDGRYYLHEGLEPPAESLVLRGENLLNEVSDESCCETFTPALVHLRTSTPPDCRVLLPLCHLQHWYWADGHSGCQQLSHLSAPCQWDCHHWGREGCWGRTAVEEWHQHICHWDEQHGTTKYVGFINTYVTWWWLKYQWSVCIYCVRTCVCSMNISLAFHDSAEFVNYCIG